MRGGCTNNNDFKIEFDNHKFEGEYKLDLAAAFGQINLLRKDGKWEIDEKSFFKRKLYSNTFLHSTITENNTTYNLLDYLNIKQPENYVPPSNYKRAKDIYSDIVDIRPAICYLLDHHVDILQIDSHGTYYVNNNLSTILSELQGTGRFRIRQKHAENSRTVQFDILNLNKSSINISNENELKCFIEGLKYV